MTKRQLSQADLAQFTGGGDNYRHQSGLVYTEGVQYMAEQAGAYWLIDAVASYQGEKSVRSNQRLQEFQLWELTVKTGHGGQKSAVLTLREDSDEPPIVEQQIEYTDFPLDYIKLYVEGSVILLPSEH